MSYHRKPKGFTLLEMMLVMAIMGTVMAMVIGFINQRTQQMRDDKTTAQLQQVLNAGLAYYVGNSAWPAAGLASTLVPTYLTGNFANNLWGNPFNIGFSPGSATTPPALFFVYTQIGPTSSTNTTNGEALAIAGRLPMGYTATIVTASPPAQATCTVGAVCYVVAAVNIPGQNLNNASAMNFAGLYHPGACVPVPTCPVDALGASMVPEVFVVPVSVSGLNDPGNRNLYPISSFTAYATSASATPSLCSTDYTGTSDGATSTAGTGCNTMTGTAASGQYWRACLQVVTAKGNVSSTNPSWDNLGYVAAFTRCSKTNEASGSTMAIFGY